MSLSSSSSQASSGRLMAAMEQVGQQIERVEAQIEEVEQQIQRTQQQIERCEAQMDDCREQTERVALDKKVDRLSKEKEQLRKKEEQLRKEKEQLRDERKLLLLQQQPLSTVPANESLVLEKLEQLKLQQQQMTLQQQQVALQQQQDKNEIKAELADIKKARTADVTSPTAAVRGERMWRNCTDKVDATGVDGFTAAFLEQKLHSPGATKLLSCPDATRLPILDEAAIQALTKQFPPSYDYMEKELIAFLTPYLLAVVNLLPDMDQLLVNSEHLEWIRTESSNRKTWCKPDLFLCHSSAFISGAEPGGNSDRSHEAQRIRQMQAETFKINYLFGRCEWKLRDAVECILEGKRRTLSLHEALGECHTKAQYLLADHHDLRGVGQTIHAARKCVLFDESNVYLLRFSSQGLLSSVYFHWATPGSLLTLLDFLHGRVQPPWLRVLKEVTSRLSVTIDSPGAFLGEGATAKVFRVVRTHTDSTTTAAALSTPPAGSSSTSSSSGTPRLGLTSSKMALKIVDDTHQGLHITALRHEVEHLRQHSTTAASCSVLLPRLCHPSMVAVRAPDSGVLIGGGMLFEPVGEPLTHSERTEQLWSEVCDALMSLHQSGILHGDPRMANLIRVPMEVPKKGAAATRTRDTVQQGSRLVWIDFRTASAGHDLVGFASDCIVLMESFFLVNWKLDSEKIRVARIQELAKLYQNIMQKDDAAVNGDSPATQPSPTAASTVVQLHAWRNSVWKDDLLRSGSHSNKI